MNFDLEACRFHFSARRVIQFPIGMAGNVLRGALGSFLRRTADAEDYARIFEPAARAVGEPAATGPSGFANWPRPFVIRCSALNGRVVQPGEQFCFNMNVFDTRKSFIDHLTRALAQWAELLSLERSPVRIALDAPDASVSRIRVDFQTPTELKADGAIGGAEFPVLLARARDRLSTLRSLYGAGPLAIDFRTLAGRAASVKAVRSELRRVALERRSSRTGQRHGIGGMVGSAEYEGDLAEFMPYLEAASWTGIGRHCTWGNGQITTEILASGF